VKDNNKRNNEQCSESSRRERKIFKVEQVRARVPGRNHHYHHHNNTRELENLLKHGAYNIFQEEKDGSGLDASTKFVDFEVIAVPCAGSAADLRSQMELLDATGGKGVFPTILCSA
jgi:hypothetical protein